MTLLPWFHRQKGPSNYLRDAMFLLDLVSSQTVYKFALALLVMLVVLTLASQFGQYIYLELTTHFRLQYVLVAIFCALLLAPFQAWKFVTIAVLCAVLNASYIWPYYRVQPGKEAKSANRLKLFHANVFKKSRNYQKLLQLVVDTNADVVILQELTDMWSTQMEVLKDSYPYMEVAPRREGAGMALLSRYPLEDVQVLTFDSSTHIAIMAKVNVNGATLTLLSLHPTTPVTPTKFRNRNQQLREAAKLLSSISGPKVLVGDLNTTMWSPYFTDLVRSAGLRDARLGFGLETTWPVPAPAFIRIPIDHCLVSKEVGVENLEVGPFTGSDHRPLIVNLTVQEYPSN
jgi:endonuclease/exonuclease/phosphatase (EEP) superfamily protein YafD